MSVNMSSGLERDPIGHMYSHAKAAVDQGVGPQDTCRQPNSRYESSNQLLALLKSKVSRLGARNNINPRYWEASEATLK